MEELPAASEWEPPPKRKKTQVSPQQYYAHRLQVREVRHAWLDAAGDIREGPAIDDDGRVLLDDALNRAGRLFQEYCCMALAKTGAWGSASPLLCGEVFAARCPIVRDSLPLCVVCRCVGRPERVAAPLHAATLLHVPTTVD